MRQNIGRLIIIMLLFCAALAAAEEKFNLPQPGTGSKMYYPGDIVHIVVGAPSNVVEVVAILPDGERLKMDFDRRNHTWHGYWEVPFSFKKGSYRANLMATDVEGKNFEGMTNIFFIGEPSLITMIGLESSGKPGNQSAVEDQTVAVEPITESAQPFIRTASPAPVKKYVPPGSKKPIRPKPAAKAKKRPKTSAAAADNSLLKARLITNARSFIADQDYRQAQASLKALLVIEPKNPEVMAVLKRLDAVVKAKGGN